LFLWCIFVLFPITNGHEGDSEHAHTANVIGLEVHETPTPVKLPKPLSDFTAVESGGKVYISGGCDSVNGNTFVTDLGFFVCDSVSDQQYEFEIASLTFSEGIDMPRMRYRHAAVIVNDQLILVGGRDVADNIIKEVDVSSSGSGVSV
jgi:hypothetical protein